MFECSMMECVEQGMSRTSVIGCWERMLIRAEMASRSRAELSDGGCRRTDIVELVEVG